MKNIVHMFFQTQLLCFVYKEYDFVNNKTYATTTHLPNIFSQNN